MGCASSHLLNHDDDFSQIGSSAFGHHIVSLTSTTYGLLTLDPSSSSSPTTTVPPTLPSRFTFGSVFSTPLSEPKSDAPPEVINSWELMAGLDSTTESFRFSPQPSKPFPFRYTLESPIPDRKNPILKENSNPNNKNQGNSDPDHKAQIFIKPVVNKPLSLGGFEELCPPKGENKVVIYTTSLRGVRKTFEACNAVRSVIQGFGVYVCERDISMDRGFREELRELMKGKDSSELVPPRVFVKGRYLGGADEVLRIVEEGCLEQLLEGMPKLKAGYVCEGCGGVRFLPCFSCNGSHKMVMVLKEDIGGKQQGKSLVVQCADCNENGLVHCPLCS